MKQAMPTWTGRLILAGMLWAWALAPAAAAQAEGGESPPTATFTERVDVREVSVPLRIVDRKGRPVLGLSPDDLAVTIGDETVPVRSLVWHESQPSSEPEQPHAKAAQTEGTENDTAEPGLELGPMALDPAATLRRDDARSVVNEEGRLVVLFVQIGHHQVVTMDEAYVGGHLKLQPYLESFLDSLPPNDPVALVSFDSKLKLWVDFTRDRRKIFDRIYDAVGFAEPDPQPNESGPSFFDRFDFEAAAEATDPEEALRIVGEALAPYPGVKEIVFLGWGLGRYVEGFGVITPPSQIRATLALRKAQASVHVLDVMQSGHALALGLQTMAKDTGGTYAATYRWPRREVARLGRILRGHYLLVLDPTDFPDDAGRLRVELSDDLRRSDAIPRVKELRIVHSPLILGGPRE